MGARSTTASPKGHQIIEPFHLISRGCDQTAMHGLNWPGLDRVALLDGNPIQELGCSRVLKLNVDVYGVLRTGDSEHGRPPNPDEHEPHAPTREGSEENKSEWISPGQSEAAVSFRRSICWLGHV